MNKEAISGKRRGALGLSAGVVAMLIPAAFATTAKAATMTCSVTGYCVWGYNYMGSGVNQNLTGAWGYWKSSNVDKQSGGQIAHGFNSAAHCYAYMNGTSYYTGVPSSLGTGCGGYLQPFAQWTGGATSYLKMQDYA
jgi:hypothetical protein